MEREKKKIGDKILLNVKKQRAEKEDVFDTDVEKQTVEEKSQSKEPADLNLLIQLLKKGGYIKDYKAFFKHYNPVTSLYLSNLIEKWEYFSRRKMLKDGEWFFLTSEKITEEIGMSKSQQQNCKRKLMSDKVIETKLKGYPQKEWFKINGSTLLSILVQVPLLSDNHSAGNSPNDKMTVPPDLSPFGKKLIERETHPLFNDNKINKEKNEIRSVMKSPPIMKDNYTCPMSKDLKFGVDGRSDREYCNVCEEKHNVIYTACWEATPHKTYKSKNNI